MSEATTPKLQANPYTRSPIKKAIDLKGRSRELKSIRYYLGLTAAGQSPHLALIGQRGIGKTSLMNGAANISKELKLLPVRCDMNELKASSPGRFWHDLYYAVLLALAKAGCWEGIHGAVYPAQLQMLAGQKPSNMENMVLQVPYLFSCHQGDVEDFECPDSLVVSDFEVFLSELAKKDIGGLILLIDEADCLGQNVPLLQMFRNIFQSVERCSLILAGTEAVFPALSEVFSPIPRQFHRVDVKPFASWYDTMSLALGPIVKEQRTEIGPDTDVVRELHELCGGAPDEAQLYCHHMFKSVEDGHSKKMELSPQVFREVLREYRANTPANVDAVLNAIERLPDKLLFESSWLSRRQLTKEENIHVAILEKEIEANRSFSADEKRKIRENIEEGYQTIFERGITQINNCIRLAGDPLTSGFWKSFVNVERGKKWSWDDSSYADQVYDPIVRRIAEDLKAAGVLRNITGEGLGALLALREHKISSTSKEEYIGELVISAIIAHQTNSTHAADFTVQVSSQAGKQTFRTRIFEKPGLQLDRASIGQWIEDHKSLLENNEVAILLTDFEYITLPSSEELHRLGKIFDFPVPELFGPSQNALAIQHFKNGDIPGCMAILQRVLDDREDHSTRNNLAFCQLLVGDVGNGTANAKIAAESDDEPLYELNQGIGEALQGNIDTAINALNKALTRIQNSKSSYSEAVVVLILGSDLKSVHPIQDMTTRAAIMINLWRLGAIKETNLKTELSNIYPERWESWIVSLPA